MDSFSYYNIETFKHCSFMMRQKLSSRQFRQNEKCLCLCLCLPICLYVCLSVCLSVYLLPLCLSLSLICFFAPLFINLFFVCLFVSVLSIFLVSNFLFELKLHLFSSSPNPSREREHIKVPENRYREGGGNCFYENFGNYQEAAGKSWSLNPRTSID